MTTPAVIRRFTPGTDAYGNPTRTQSYTDTHIKCWIAPTGSDEDRENRNQVTFEYTVFVSGNHDIRHHDQLIADISVYDDGSGDGFSETLTVEVVGAPKIYRRPNGQVNHVQLDCRRVEG